MQKYVQNDKACSRACLTTVGACLGRNSSRDEQNRSSSSRNEVQIVTVVKEGTAVATQAAATSPTDLAAKNLSLVQLKVQCPVLKESFTNLVKHFSGLNLKLQYQIEYSTCVM